MSAALTRSTLSSKQTGALARPNRRTKLATVAALPPREFDDAEQLATHVSAGEFQWLLDPFRLSPRSSLEGFCVPTRGLQGAVDTGATALEGSEAKSEARKGQSVSERAAPFEG